VSATTVPVLPATPKLVHGVTCVTGWPAIVAIDAHGALQLPGTGVGAIVGAAVVVVVVTGQVNWLPRPSVRSPVIRHAGLLPEQQSGCAVSKLMKYGSTLEQNAAETLATQRPSWIEQQPSVHVGGYPSRSVQNVANPASQHAVFDAKMSIPTAAQFAAGTPSVQMPATTL
jgi:hypothetical protein